jgi:hypothetical protein
VQPGVARADVPTGTVAITLPLSVIPSAATVSGVVLDPDGNPLPRIAVAAINLENPRGGGAQVLTREDGSFNIGLDYGAYQISIFGPAERQEAREWISPEPQRVKLTPSQPSETLEFRFRRGDATISGRISLAASVQAGQPKLPALVWAANRDGHTKEWASEDRRVQPPGLAGANLDRRRDLRSGRQPVGYGHDGVGQQGGDSPGSDPHAALHPGDRSGAGRGSRRRVLWRAG